MYIRKVRAWSIHLDAYLSGATTRCFVVGQAPRKASEAILAPLEGDLFKLLQVNFAEFPFHALR
jgi:hypothetical protein